MNGHFWVYSPTGGYTCRYCGGWTDLLQTYVYPCDSSFTLPPLDGEATSSGDDRPRCVSCGLELSSTLDAYFGRNHYHAAQCSNCRPRYGVVE